MNELNQWEKELQSWIPRGPSARLKERLFPAAAAALEPQAAPGFSMWARLAPAVCIAMLAAFFSLAPHEKAGYLAVTNGSNALASLSSNLLGFCATNTRCVQVNVAEMPETLISFERPGAVRGELPAGPFPLSKTNLQRL